MYFENRFDVIFDYFAIRNKHNYKILFIIKKYFLKLKKIFNKFNNLKILIKKKNQIKTKKNLKKKIL